MNKRKITICAALIAIMSSIAGFLLLNPYERIEDAESSASSYTPLNSSGLTGMIDPLVEITSLSAGDLPSVIPGKLYKRSSYGIEFIVPSDWSSFRGVKFEPTESGGADIKFFFETKEVGYFREENCYGKCMDLFSIFVFTHDEYNNFFEPRFEDYGNLMGKLVVLGVNNQYVFVAGDTVSDPPEDLKYLGNDRRRMFRTMQMFNVK